MSNGTYLKDQTETDLQQFFVNQDAPLPEASPKVPITSQQTDDEPTPLMPISGFPMGIQGIITECSETYGTHRDLWTAAFIAATATAIGQSMVVKTKYENPPLFWIAQVGASGVGKSEPGDFCFKRLHEIDFEKHQEHKENMQRYQAALASWKKSKDGSNPPAKPKLFQRIIIDSTPEALAGAMEVNSRGITIFRDEITAWIYDFGRYAKSGEQQNMLSSYSQSLFKVNRVTSENIVIPKPCINVFGGIQPGKLIDLAKDGRQVDGFLPRFCFAFPDRIEAPNYKHGRLSNESREYYNQYIETMISSQEYRKPIELSEAAEAVYESFYNKNAAINNSQNQPDYLNEVNAKLNIIALRLALLFYCSKQAIETTNFLSGKESAPTGTFIQSDTMKQAIELTEYFRITAKKVYDIISQTAKDKKQIIRYLSDLGNSQTDIANSMKVSQQYVSKVLRL